MARHCPPPLIGSETRNKLVVAAVLLFLIALVASLLARYGLESGWVVLIVVVSGVLLPSLVLPWLRRRELQTEGSTATFAGRVSGPATVERRRQRVTAGVLSVARVAVIVGSVGVLTVRVDDLTQLLDRAMMGHVFAVKETFATQLGEHKSVQLPGGLAMVLNTATTVRTRTTRRSQDVELESGEILIDGSTSAEPLRIVAGAVIIESGYAKFSLRRERDGAYALRVFSGMATLSPLRSRDLGAPRRGEFVPVRLEAGRSTVITPDKLTLSRFEPEEAERRLAWMRGELSFRDDTLADAVAEFNRYNRQQIVIGDPAISRFRVGGTFKATNVDGFVRALESMFDIHAVSLKSGGRGASVVVLTSGKGSSQVPVIPDK